MANFRRLNKHNLTNGQHYTLLQAFLTLLTTAQLAGARIAALVAQLQAGFQKEDDLMKLAQGSTITKLLEDADKARDLAYRTLKAICELWAKNPYEDKKAAAEHLLQLMNVYKLDPSAQYDDESGVMTNLLQPLTSADETYSADLQKLGLIDVVRTMMQQNQEVIRLLAERDLEDSTKVLGALRTQRQENDRVYDQLLRVIESYCDVADEPEKYEKLVSDWNGTLDRYQRMLDRKSGKNSPDDDPEPTPDSDSDDKSDDEKKD